MATDNVSFFIPEENKEEFDRLFNVRNQLMLDYGKILKMIKDINPSPYNFEKCKDELRETAKYVEKWGNAVIRWVNEISVYELNLNYQYGGPIQENFQYISFKLMLQNFLAEMFSQREFILKGFNDKSIFNKSQENIALSHSLIDKITKFAKNHPYFFFAEVIIHVISIILLLNEIFHFIKIH
jgi:hypothetical protein